VLKLFKSASDGSNRHLLISKKKLTDNYILRFKKRAKIELSLLVVMILALVMAIASGSLAPNQRSTSSKVLSATINKPASVETAHLLPATTTTQNITPASSSIVTNEQSTNSSDGPAKSSTQISVDGKQVGVPANGSTVQTINNGTSQTSVQVNNGHSSTGSSFSSNVTSTSLNSTSSSSDSSTQESGL
jgi:hypothetical protein